MRSASRGADGVSASPTRTHAPASAQRRRPRGSARAPYPRADFCPSKHASEPVRPSPGARRAVSPGHAPPSATRDDPFRRLAATRRVIALATTRWSAPRCPRPLPPRGIETRVGGDGLLLYASSGSDAGAARLLLLCLLLRSSWLTVEDDRHVGAAGVLHRQGGRAAVAVSVGVAVGVPTPAVSLTDSKLPETAGLHQRRQSGRWRRHCSSSARSRREPGLTALCGPSLLPERALRGTLTGQRDFGSFGDSAVHRRAVLGVARGPAIARRGVARGGSEAAQRGRVVSVVDAPAAR